MSLIEQVRCIDLVRILDQIGATIDKSDPKKWHTPMGSMSISGQQFYNWSESWGGGGAIDCVMHLKGMDFNCAVTWILENFFITQPLSSQQPSIKLPKSQINKLPRVIDYLTHQRDLPSALVYSLIQSGIIYADDKANAVFLMRSKRLGIVGAEIRGTMKHPWRGLAPGSKKNRGCFYVRTKPTKKVVICESAIDAISCHTLHPECMAVSTAGVNPNPRWITAFLENEFEVYCGFDADSVGDSAADKMMSLYAAVKRMRPLKHDWNEELSNGARDRFHISTMH